MPPKGDDLFTIKDLGNGEKDFNLPKNEQQSAFEKAPKVSANLDSISKIKIWRKRQHDWRKMQRKLKWQEKPCDWLN